MFTVSGRLIFDVDRTATITAGDTGIFNVPIVLQDINTMQKLTVLTDINGNFSFYNVPNGDYRLVEAYGEPHGIPTPGNFSAGIVSSIPDGTDPPFSYVTSPPATTNDLDSLSPNTLFITVNNSDLTDQNFFDGPIINSPIDSLVASCVTVSSTNLITAADNGTFGSFPQGTPVETGANPDPYPGLSSGFSYILPSPPATRPIDGSYTIQNIMTNMSINNSNTWWRLADHTVGDETGRFQAIGGSNPGSSFFEDVVSVTPNTTYLFSAWITNLIRNPALAEPALGVEILDQNNNVLYSQSLSNTIPASTVAPEWKELGTGINSGPNSQLTVRFLSEGPAAVGNDFAIDDISLREFTIEDLSLEKCISNCLVTQGATVTFTNTFCNPCSEPFTNLFFIDILPFDINFIPDSVDIDGTNMPGLDPTLGFLLPDLAPNTCTTICFMATVDNPPSVNQIENISTITFDFIPVSGGINLNYSIDSNKAYVKVVDPQADEISIRAIVEAESGIIDCMARFFGTTGGVKDIISNISNTSSRTISFSNILNSYSSKEASLGNVLKGASRKLGADKDIILKDCTDTCIPDFINPYNPCAYNKEQVDTLNDCNTPCNLLDFYKCSCTCACEDPNN